MGGGCSCTRKGIFCVENIAFSELECSRYRSQAGTFGTECAVRKRGVSRNLPYSNAKPRKKVEKQEEID